jgi:integrase
LKIFHDALPEKIKPLFLFLASSGLRITEALSLQNSDVDFAQEWSFQNHIKDKQSIHGVTFYNNEVGIFTLLFGYG